jgi:hypothetical protein
MRKSARWISRSVPRSLTKRWYGNEVLGHSKSEVDMTRIQNGASLLWNHDPNQLIGVVEKAAIGSDKVGRATVFVSEIPQRRNEVFQRRSGRHLLERFQSATASTT